MHESKKPITMGEMKFTSEQMHRSTSGFTPRGLVLGCAMILGFNACAPSANSRTVPAQAGTFARLVFPTSAQRVRLGFENALGRSTGGFYPLGTTSDNAFEATWTLVAGQSARVYFQFESQGESTVVRVLTLPAPPPEPTYLARSLERVASEIKSSLNLAGFSLTPDR